MKLWLLVLGLTLLALALRAALFGTARFGGDEALFFRLATDIVDGRSFPLLGTQITDGAGRLPGPLFLWLMALPLLVERSPEAQFLFTAVCASLGVGVFVFAAARTFSLRAAAFAGTLLALSPWSALYGDRTWNPHLFLVAVSMAIALSLALARAVTVKALVAWCCVLAALPQLHTSFPVAWLACAALCGPSLWRAWCTSRSTVGWGFFFGLVAGAVLYVPYAVHEWQTGLANTRHILGETVSGASTTPWGFLATPLYALRLLTLDVSYHELSGYWGGPNEWANLKAAAFGSAARPFAVWRVVPLLSSLLLLLLTLRTLPSLLRDPTPQRSPIGWAWLLALVANTALLGIAGKQVFGHYVLVLLPLGALLWAHAFDAAGARMQRLMVGLALLFCAGGVEATLNISRRIDARIGLHVHREVLLHIAKDTDAAHATQPIAVSLDVKSPHHPMSFALYAKEVLHLPLHFHSRARYRYVLTPQARPLNQATHEPPTPIGPMLLYKVQGPP